MGKLAALRSATVGVVMLFLLISCGNSTTRSVYPHGAQQPELQIDLRIAQAPGRSDSLNLTIERITRISAGPPICLDTLTQVVSNTSPGSDPADQSHDRSNYQVDMHTLSGGVLPFCLGESEQVPDTQLPAQPLTITTQSSSYPYDRVQFLHSIAIAQANPARQIPILVIYHIDIAGRIVEQLHASTGDRGVDPDVAITEVVLVRPWIYQIFVPIIVGALLACALLMMLIHERATFIQATIAMTVGTWNARQLILPANDLHPVMLDQILLLIYALIWVSFAIFTIRLQRKHI